MDFCYFLLLLAQTCVFQTKIEQPGHSAKQIIQCCTKEKGIQDWIQKRSTR